MCDLAAETCTDGTCYWTVYFAFMAALMAFIGYVFTAWAPSTHAELNIVLGFASVFCIVGSLLVVYLTVAHPVWSLFGVCAVVGAVFLFTWQVTTYKIKNGEMGESTGDVASPTTCTFADNNVEGNIGHSAAREDGARPTKDGPQALRQNFFEKTGPASFVDARTVLF